MSSASARPHAHPHTRAPASRTPANRHGGKDALSGRHGAPTPHAHKHARGAGVTLPPAPPHAHAHAPKPLRGGRAPLWEEEEEEEEEEGERGEEGEGEGEGEGGEANRIAADTRPVARARGGAAVKSGAPTRSETQLHVNRDFAAKYEVRKRRQELARAEELGLLSGGVDGAEGSEEEESEDEGELLTADLDQQIQHTLEAIRRKDGSIYDSSRAFFAESTANTLAPGDAASASKPVAPPKKVRAKDVLRQQLTEAAEKGVSDAFVEDESIAAAHGRRHVDDGDRNPRVYDAEQQELRKAFLHKATAAAAAAESSSDEEDLLAPRPKSSVEEAAPAPVDKGALRKLLRSKRGGGLAEHAGDIADPEAFLTAFMRTRAWQDEEAAAAKAAVPRYEEIVAADDADEEELNKADDFEAAYNFRFEEPGGTAIVTHARNVEGSLRRKDDKRKQERERSKEQKSKARAEAEAETRRLMNLKRQELAGRMERIQSVTGASLDADALFAALGDELDTDFDPATYDAKMAALFGDAYYAEEETEAVPRGGGAVTVHAEDDDEESEDSEEGVGAPGWVFGDGPRPAWAGPSAEELALGIDGFEEGSTLRGADATADDDEEEEEVDAAVSGHGRARKQRRKGKAIKMRSDVARALALVEEEERAARARHADPDEVLQLGFEDVIAGGLKTRFKYTPVPSQDFGLSVDDILMLDDHDLNGYVGLKRMAPYRDQEWEVPRAVRKHALRKLRAQAREEAAKVFGTTTAPAVEAGATPEEATHELAPEEGVEETPVTAEAAEVEATVIAEQEMKRNRRRRHSKKARVNDDAGDAAPLDAAPLDAAPLDAAKAVATDLPGVPGKRSRDDAAAAPAPAPAAAPVPAVTTSAEKLSRRRRRQQRGTTPDRHAHEKKSGTTSLPSGVVMKKARLASYNL